ncbi:MAG: coproporphyrinogen-III oxidase family protein [Bacteriovorax sp.]|nr:coproporphyrinogen-III oxidase family protein [Bacteriovorax sp.]
MPKRIDSLYLHFPFCSHLCNYCDFYKKVPQNKTLDYQKYHDYLESSFLVHKNLIEKYGYSWSPLKTFYIGGGTPSLWGKEGKIFLQNFLNEKNIQLDPECEFTLEVNPGAWDEEVLSQWRSLGVNRFSLGVQSLQKEMITYLDRIHSIEDVYTTLEYFRDNKLNFSVDFMLGLPFSKEYKRDVIKELQIALSYNPNHFSVYILTVKDNYTHFNNLPDEEWVEHEFLLVADFLKANGFEHYEVSNFSRPKKQSEHNLNYWRSHSVAALGPSATGFLFEDRLRYKWKPNQPEIELEFLTEEEFNLEKIYMAIRSQVGLNMDDFPKSLEGVVINWKEKLLVTEENKIIKLTSKGYLLLDSLMNDLFLLKLV